MEYHVYWSLKISCFEFFYSKVPVLIFSGIEYTVFFEPKSWWKDDICWELRSSYFEIFSDSKYGLFSVKKVMERWFYWVFLSFSVIFQDLENMVFRAVQYIEYKSNSDESRAISIKEYLQINRSHLKEDIINKLEIYDQWKIHLTKRINFVSTKILMKLCNSFKNWWHRN